MPEIGARRFHHARLSRVLARPGRHARAPTDSTGTPGMPNSGGERTRKKKVCEIFGHDRGKRWEDGFFIMTFAGRSGRLALPAGISNARGATCSRHHGVAHSVPREQDGGSREATGGLRGAHGGNHGEVRGSVRAAKSVTRPAIGPWGGVRHRTPPSVFPSRATPVAPHAVVADPLASASSRPSPAGRKLEPAHEDARVLGQGQDAEHCAYARPSLGRLHEPRGVLPPSPARAATFPARSRHLPNAHPAHSRPPRAARLARARPGPRAPRDACPPGGAPETLPHPADRPKSQKPQYKFRRSR